MRRSAEQTAKRKNICTIILGLLACLGAVFLCLLVFSFIAANVGVSDGILGTMSGISLAAGCFAASYTVAKRRGKNGFLTGIACGGIVFLAVLICGMIFVRSFSAGGFFTKLLIILSCSGIGGIIGVNSPRRFR